MWHKPLLIIWYFIALVIVLGAICVSSIRFYPASYQHYLPEIQENISEIIGRPVNVQSLHLRWRNFSPQIIVDDLSIYSDETKQDRLLFVNEAHLAIDIYSSVFSKKIKISQLTLNGGNLRIERTTDQRIILNGIDISEIIAKSRKSNDRNNIRIGLLGSTVDFKDRIKNLEYFFDRVNILVSVKDEALKITSRFLLPEKLGRSLILTADLIDYDQGLKNLKGTIYSKGKDINLELLAEFLPQLELGLQSGNLDFETWGVVSSSLKHSFKGSLSLNVLKYNKPELLLEGVAENREITEFKSNFQVDGVGDDWYLALSDALIRDEEKQWQGKNYELKCMSCTKSDFLISAAFDYIDLVNVYSTIQHFSNFINGIHEFVAKIQVEDGVFSDVRILTLYKNNRIDKYSIKSSIQDLDISLPSQQLEITSLSGDISGSHIQGELKIDANGMNFQASKYFDKAFQNHNIAGTIKWRQVHGHTLVAFDQVFLDTDSTTAELQGTLQINNGIAYVDFQGQVLNSEAQAIKMYLPYKKMKPKLAKWLRESIKNGAINNGKFLFQGNPKLFPFKNNVGTFEVTANIDNGLLEYKKEWPPASNIKAELRIKNNMLTVNGDHGKILGSTVHHFSAKIEDLKLPRLIIDGNASGDAEDILEFLKMSSLLPKNSQVLKLISANGNSKLDLNIILTLTKKLEKERIVNGVIEFDNTNLTVTSVGVLPFTNLKGKLNFDKCGATGKGLSAKLYGLIFTGDAQKLDNGRTALNIKGDFDFDSYFSSYNQKLHSYIQDTTPVNVVVNIPKFGKYVEDKSLELKIDANLLGTTVALPDPFNKDKDEQKCLYINANFEPRKDHPIYASFNNYVFLKSTYNREKKTISAIDLRFGDDKFKLANEGLRISGKIDQLDLKSWADFLKTSNKKSDIELTEVDVQAKSISLSSLEFENLEFKLEKEEQSWFGTIDSSIARGDFSFPVDPNSEHAAIGNFKYLRINKPEKKSDILVDPRKLPSMLVNADKFELDQYSFRDVKLKTTSSLNGMIINSLTGKGDDLAVTSSGSWDIDADNIQSTQLDIYLDSDNLKNTIIGLGYKTLLEKGEGYVTSNLNWPGAPYQFSTASFSGTANIRFKDGEFSSVKPGAGRFIGLVNLSEISKRLSLDFKDFFSKGYVFDKFRGDLLFKNGNLMSDNLKIEGSSADILIQGRTGLVAKDYDQIITVTPQISGGLPWVGLAVGGPIGAVGVIVGEKVAESIGVDFNKVTQVKYTMKGTWEEPKLEAISHKVANTSQSAQGQPSPQQINSSQKK